MEAGGWKLEAGAKTRLARVNPLPRLAGKSHQVFRVGTAPNCGRFQVVLYCLHEALQARAAFRFAAAVPSSS